MFLFDACFFRVGVACVSVIIAQFGVRNVRSLWIVNLWVNW